MAVVIVFEYGDDLIPDPETLAMALAQLREAVTPQPDAIHVAVRETADAVLAPFKLANADA